MTLAVAAHLSMHAAWHAMAMTSTSATPAMRARAFVAEANGPSAVDWDDRRACEAGLVHYFIKTRRRAFDPRRISRTISDKA